MGIEPPQFYFFGALVSVKRLDKEMITLL